MSITEVDGFGRFFEFDIKNWKYFRGNIQKTRVLEVFFIKSPKTRIFRRKFPTAPAKPHN